MNKNFLAVVALLLIASTRENLRAENQISARDERTPLHVSDSNGAFPIEIRQPQFRRHQDNDSNRRMIFSKDLFKACQSFRPSYFPVQVTHLAQLHDDPGTRFSNKMMEDVARSQYTIAKYILKNPNSEIFTESLADDLDKEKLQKSERLVKIQKNVQNVFPSGNIPQDFSELSEAQEDILRIYGGELTLFLLGHINHLHKTISREDYDRVSLKTSLILKKDSPNIVTPFSKNDSDSMTGTKESDQLIIDERENLAVKEILSHLEHSKSPEKEIVLIYGSAHHFDAYFKSCAWANFKRVATGGY